MWTQIVKLSYTFSSNIMPRPRSVFELAPPLPRKEKALIRDLFKAHRGSQREVARKIGIADTTLSRWLRGAVRSRRLDEQIPKVLKRHLEVRGASAA